MKCALEYKSEAFEINAKNGLKNVDVVKATSGLGSGSWVYVDLFTALGLFFLTLFSPSEVLPTWLLDIDVHLGN